MALFLNGRTRHHTYKEVLYKKSKEEYDFSEMCLVYLVYILDTVFIKINWKKILKLCL